MSKRVLVIDDDLPIRTMVRQVLELEGYQVQTAGDGKEAYEILTKSSLPCLILLDLMMPTMNGWEFLDALKGNPAFAEVPIVIMSAYSDLAKGIESRERVTKPFLVETLLETVARNCQH